MSEAAHDLTGRWTGVYFYPVDPEVNPDDDWPPTPFTAVLLDAGGRITGSTLEPDTLGPDGSPPIAAVLEGHHLEGQLIFTKFPDSERQIDTIDYVGEISGDGNSIGGRWIIHGDWSGTFQMQRKVVTAGATAEASTSV